MGSKARGLADLGNVYNDGALSNRNLIINGAMTVAQRGTSDVTGLTEADDGYKTVDRWKYVASSSSNTGQITMSFETDAPNGFKYSTKYLVTTADTDMGTNSALRLETHLEAQNLRHLNYGSSDAQQVTLSFWVKSNKTGSYSAGLYMDSATGDKEISQAYTVNSADTWEYKALTFSANTATTMNPTDNDHGLRVWFQQASGSDYTSGSSNTWGDSSQRAVGQSVNLYDTVNNYWQITGVQLEVGDTATPFEHPRSYGDELARCKRYYEKSYNQGTALATATALGARSSGGNQAANTTGEVGTYLSFAASKRAAPSVTIYDLAGNSGKTTISLYGTGTTANQTGSVSSIGQGSFFVSRPSGSNATELHVHFTADAEL